MGSFERVWNRHALPGWKSQGSENWLQALRLCKFQAGRAWNWAIRCWGKVTVARGKCGLGKVANLEYFLLHDSSHSIHMADPVVGEDEGFKWPTTFEEFSSLMVKVCARPAPETAVSRCFCAHWRRLNSP